MAFISLNAYLFTVVSFRTDEAFIFAHHIQIRLVPASEARDRSLGFSGTVVTDWASYHFVISAIESFSTLLALSLPRGSFSLSESSFIAADR